MVDKPTLYIVFGLDTNGYTGVLAIDTEQWIARRHRQMMEMLAERYVRVWVEPRIANHLYGASSLTSLLEHDTQQLDEEVRQWARSTELITDVSLDEREATALTAANVEIRRLRADCEALRERWRRYCWEIAAVDGDCDICEAADICPLARAALGEDATNG